MEKTRLALLQADVREQLKLVENIYRKIAARKKNYARHEQALESLAYQLHNLYCAFEDLFRIVADHFENHTSDQTGWHTELLTRMKTHIDEKRVFSPPLLDFPNMLFIALRWLQEFNLTFRRRLVYCDCISGTMSTTDDYYLWRRNFQP